MPVKNMLNEMILVNFTIDFLSEKSMMEHVITGLEAVYEICD